MIKKFKNSLANRVLYTFALVFLGTNIFLFTGATVLNKSAFYQLEKEKDELLVQNYTPFLAINLFLGMDKKVKHIVKQILENSDVVEVKVYKDDKLYIKSSKKGHKCSIKISKPIFQPNSSKIIGKLEVAYTTQHFEKFMMQYFKFLLISALLIVIVFAIVYKYLKKLFHPIKRLSNVLKDFDPTQRLVIPYINQQDEIGLISNAINKLNKKSVNYSNELKDMAQILIDANQNLEIKVQKELQIIREKDKQLMHQSRLAQMGEMISMIAHQWRQPLASINSTTNNLQFKIMFDDIDKDLFEKEIKLISDYAQHLSNTIDDFRNFFKENKQMESIAIKKLVEDTLKIARVSIENHNIELKIKYQCNKSIKTYPNELKQVILNLIKNAQDVLLDKKIKNPYIGINTICKDEEIYIEVYDNGGGISDEIIDRIFEPYFSTKKEKDGTGLGLYMSKMIIDSHCNGKLTVENIKDGAKFKIKLFENGGG